MEMGRSLVKLARKQASLDAWLRKLGAIFTLDSSADEELYLPVTGARHLLTGHGCPDQIGHTDLEVQEVRSPGFFTPVSGSEAIYLLVCLASHIYVHYLMSEKKKLVELLCLEGVTILVYSVFLGHGCLQHERCGWQNSHIVR